jgi:hypothetical protein
MDGADSLFYSLLRWPLPKEKWINEFFQANLCRFLILLHYFSTYNEGESFVAGQPFLWSWPLKNGLIESGSISFYIRYTNKKPVS